ncbi:MAG: isoleucine--tRNA ligase, partial [Pseudomonadota bacterium]
MSAETPAADVADQVTQSEAETAPDYRDTLFLPSTDFPMRAGLPKREPQWLERWARQDVYNRLRASAAGRTPFALHDGPPYANGHLHIGHALNKVLKDFVVRSHQMMGYDSRYVPGWDCHGLPIEWKIEEKYRAKGKSKDAVPINELRAECRAFAEQWVDIQRAEFKRLGVTGAWERPYLTMAFEAEATIAAEFHRFVMNGSLYQGSKPVMWSPMEQTALADAEVEYHDREVDTVWVKFPIKYAPSVVSGSIPLTASREVVTTFLKEKASQRAKHARELETASVLIWTTTPWTIPSNRAIAFGDGVSYGLYIVTGATPDGNWVQQHERFVVADALASEFFGRARLDPQQWTRVRDVGADDLEGMVCAHPLRGVAGGEGFWDYDVPLMPAGFVTDDTGSGFVHCAPSHGEDDYDLFRQHGMLDRITHNVGPDGGFESHVPLFHGTFILNRKGKDGTANKAVIEKLKETGMLAATRRQKISDAHSWRSKAPVIRLNRPQWLVAIDRPLDDGMGQHGATIRERALAAIDAQVRWVPRAGRNRIHSMMEARPDWVLSRQRAWGVPLACFARRTAEGEVELLRDEAVNARIVDAFRAEGADAWYADGARERFLAGVADAESWEKVDDILDVWFDSGSTHAFVMRDREDGVWPADVYLEGTDQHRGWFHSSILQACGTRGRAPYKAVVTHGFTLDENGQKMSKSLGNTVAPEDVIKQYGADILRLWAAQADFSADQRIGPEILKGTADSYRRLRNGFRYLLGALNGWDPATAVEPAEMPELERWVLHRLAVLDGEVRAGYRDFDYQSVVSKLFGFVTSDLSAFYFDVRKDALYCDPADSVRRRSALTVMDAIFRRLSTWLAPILVFTMEEVWLSRFGEGDDVSVHLVDFEPTPEAWRDDALAEKWAHVRRARRAVNGALEVARGDKTIGASLEAAPTLYAAVPAIAAALDGLDMAELCITSGLTVVADVPPEEAWLPEDAGDTPALGVVFGLAEGEKCARCWKVLPDVGQHAFPG